MHSRIDIDSYRQSSEALRTLYRLTKGCFAPAFPSLAVSSTKLPLVVRLLQRRWSLRSYSAYQISSLHHT